VTTECPPTWIYRHATEPMETPMAKRRLRAIEPFGTITFNAHYNGTRGGPISWLGVHLITDYCLLIRAESI